MVEAKEKKATYPMLSAKSWWALRKKLHDSARVKVTETYLASLLGIEVRSARINALNPFKQVGLLDDEGNPTELAMKWRDNEGYAEACENIRQNCYPQELLDLFPGSNIDAAEIARWFRNNAGVGASAANKQASFYLLLTTADASGTTEAPKRNSNGSAPKPQAKTISKPTRHNPSDAEEQAAPPSQQMPFPPQQPATQFSMFPSLHVDVQIHIAPDTSPEQIDRIFESMAKHFKGMRENTTE